MVGKSLDGCHLRQWRGRRLSTATALPVILGTSTQEGRVVEVAAGGFSLTTKVSQFRHCSCIEGTWGGGEVAGRVQPVTVALADGVQRQVVAEVKVTPTEEGGVVDGAAVGVEPLRRRRPSRSSRCGGIEGDRQW